MPELANATVDRIRRAFAKFGSVAENNRCSFFRQRDEGLFRTCKSAILDLTSRYTLPVTIPSWIARVQIAFLPGPAQALAQERRESPKPLGHRND